MNTMPRLMCHWVVGYPDAERFKQAVLTIDKIDAVEWLEIQLPFSDPLADGPVIMAANHAVLRAGLDTHGAFEILTGLKGQLRAKLALMTYANIVLAMGVEAFCQKALASGALALIVPDLPFDTPQGEALLGATTACGISLIPVISPGMEAGRLQQVLARASGFVYVTSKIGVTGSSTGQPSLALEFVRQVRLLTALPIALGFGIKTREAVRRLSGHVDIAVIGSHLLRLYNEGGVAGVEKFLKGDVSKTV